MRRLPVLTRVEIEQVEQVADRWYVHGHITIRLGHYRIRQVVAAASGQRREMPARSMNLTTDEWSAYVFPGDGPHRFILLDHDATFDGNVIGFLKATGLDPTRTAIQAP
jgi:hypothetical protein